MVKILSFICTGFFLIQSLYVIWLHMAYNRGVCRKCSRGMYQKKEESSEDRTNVQCSKCGHKVHVPNARLACGEIPCMVILLWLISAVGFMWSLSVSMSMK